VVAPAHPDTASAGDCTIGAAVWLCVLSGVSGRYVQYLNFLQDLEQLVMAAQDTQVGSRCRPPSTKTTVSAWWYRFSVGNGTCWSCCISWCRGGAFDSNMYQGLCAVDVVIGWISVCATHCVTLLTCPVVLAGTLPGPWRLISRGTGGSSCSSIPGVCRAKLTRSAASSAADVAAAAGCAVGSVNAPGVCRQQPACKPSCCWPGHLTSCG
jgi:hypothetical protein